MLAPSADVLRALGATPTLLDRLAGKIRFAATPGACDVWTGAYNIDGRKNGRRNRGRRPVIQLGRVGSPVVYVTPLLLALQNGGNLRPCCPTSGQRLYALHTCRPPADGIYRCVTLAHLQWGTQEENEAHKRQWTEHIGP